MLLVVPVALIRIYGKHLNGPEPVEQPVDGQDERDILGGQPHRVQDHDHGDEARLRDPRGADGGRRRRYAHRHHAAKIERNFADLW